jgi:regulator of sigma D
MQLSELRQIEKQIWMMLAASTEARRKLGHKPTGPYDEDVVLALKKVLAAIGERQESRFLELT